MLSGFRKNEPENFVIVSSPEIKLESYGVQAIVIFIYIQDLFCSVYKW